MHITPELEQYILKNYENKTYSEMALDLGLNSDYPIKVFLKKKNIKKPITNRYTKKYTLEQKEKVKKLLLEGKTVPEISKELLVDVNIVYDVARRNNISYVTIHKTFTEQEIDYIFQHYPQQSIKQIAKHFNRDDSVIRTKLIKLGLYEPNKKINL